MPFLSCWLTEIAHVHDSGVGLVDSITREAMLRYVDPGGYVQGVVMVQVLAPNFKL